MNPPIPEEMESSAPFGVPIFFYWAALLVAMLAGAFVFSFFVGKPL